jgi:hypothetical protein
MTAGSYATARAALDDSLAALAAVYATLDLERCPELSGYLQSVCDRCLRSIGEAHTGRGVELPPAIALLRSMRCVLQSAQEGNWPEETTTAIECKVVREVLSELRGCGLS